MLLLDKGVRYGEGAWGEGRGAIEGADSVAKVIARACIGKRLEEYNRHSHSSSLGDSANICDSAECAMCYVNRPCETAWHPGSFTFQGGREGGRERGRERGNEGADE